MVDYLDANATTPVDPRVLEELIRYTEVEYGNAGSRTHEFGARAKRRVNGAREQVALVVDADPTEIIFTSGATESNNLATLGLEVEGNRSNRRHIISTEIEHKSILEPLAVLERRGFEVQLIQARESGRVSASEVADAVRPDTLLVSMMQVNNETGICQPVAELADALSDTEVLFHVDAAQGFGKELTSLRHPRVDMISASAHKLFGPKGVGALAIRSRSNRPNPVSPLLFGGGQERGLRAGTTPVGMVAALGTACELAIEEHQSRSESNSAKLEQALSLVKRLGGEINGDGSYLLGNALNFSIPGLDSEAFILATKTVAAVSNGSACTSASYEPSHVLTSMGLDSKRIDEAIRISWSHLAPDEHWDSIARNASPFVKVNS